MHAIQFNVSRMSICSSFSLHCNNLIGKGGAEKGTVKRVSGSGISEGGRLYVNVTAKLTKSRSSGQLCQCLSR